MTKRTAMIMMKDALKYARQEAQEYVRLQGVDDFRAAMSLRFIREWLREAKKYKEVIG